MSGGELVTVRGGASGGLGSRGCEGSSIRWGVSGNCFGRGGFPRG